MLEMMYSGTHLRTSRYILKHHCLDKIIGKHMPPCLTSVYTHGVKVRGQLPVLGLVVTLVITMKKVQKLNVSRSSDDLQLYLRTNHVSPLQPRAR